MNLSTRLTRLEVELCYIKKLLYLIILGVGGRFGIDYIPVVSALLW